MKEIQEMFLLNICVNESSEKSGPDIENIVYKKIVAYLGKYKLSNWNIVWGPAIYRVVPDGKPDHVMMLAYDDVTSRYYISISGTSPYSLINWYEDFNVAKSKQWPWNNAGASVQVDTGSMLALNILQEMTAKERVDGKQIGDKLTLVQFLKNRFANSNQETNYLITGGHSLGGAISPLMALYLKDIQAEWDENNAIKDISSWPSAGPTVGTEGFKNYYDSRVPNTHRIHNTFDVVPHAWNVEDLEAIKTLYQPEISKSDCVDKLVDLNIDKVKDAGYVHAGLIDISLQGSINNDIIKWYYVPGYAFGVQLGYQHVGAYYKLLDIDPHDNADFFSKEESLSILENLSKKASKI